MYGRRPTISTLHGMVAAAHPLAAQAGARLLSSGGNAFDAAAATAAALNVVEPYMSSLGGMGLATCYIAAEKRARTLDFVTRVPSKFPVEKLKKREELNRGPVAVGTPGNLMGWGELVKSHGKRPWKEALEPAIRLARDGYPLVEFNVAEINESVVELKKYPSLYANWAPIFLGSKAWVRQGDVLKQPDLAKTFEALAANGTDHLYKGPIGRTIVEHLAKIGGTLTLGDLETAKPEWRDPIKVAYRGREVHTLSPPCEGFQCLLTLRILDGFDLSGLERNGTE
ncbi:MAG: gamma-glutamyltranspeptidase, partial [Hyphomicrobiaceae bacterium]